MQATEPLLREHDLSRRMLTVLEQVAARVRLGGVFPAEDVAIVLGYFREFVEQVHHRKESDVFYPAAVMYDEDVAETVGELVADHDESKLLLHSLTLFWEPADLLDEERDGFADLAETYCARLRRHMELEEERLFPAICAIPCDDRSHLLARFDDIGRGRKGVAQWRAEIERLEAAYV